MLHQVEFSHVCRAAMIAMAASVGLLVASPASAQAAPSLDISTVGPTGELRGAYIPAAEGRPVVLIVPGSGPTDRDGNSPLGIRAAPLRLLAEALAIRGIGSVRIDKRGMFGSAGAAADANAVTIGAYADDVAAWVDAARQRSGAPCIWLLGHSEGGMVALVAGQSNPDICGVVTISAAGRPLAIVLREQLAAQLSGTPLLDPALAGIGRLERGERVEPADIPAPLMGLLAPSVQGFLIDFMARNPSELAAALTVPMLIVQGDADIQSGVADAQALAAANPRARLVILPGVNHVLKSVATNDRAANIASYANGDLPLDPNVASVIDDFLTAADGSNRTHAMNH